MFSHRINTISSHALGYQMIQIGRASIDTSGSNRIEAVDKIFWILNFRECNRRWNGSWLMWPQQVEKNRDLDINSTKTCAGSRLENNRHTILRVERNEVIPSWSPVIAFPKYFVRFHISGASINVRCSPNRKIALQSSHMQRKPSPPKNELGYPPLTIIIINVQITILIGFSVKLMDLQNRLNVAFIVGGPTPRYLRIVEN